MKTTPFMHARRKLRHVKRFQELKDHTPEEIAWLAEAGICVDGVIGCYRCLGIAPPVQTLVILEDCIKFWTMGRMRSILYKDIAHVAFNDGLEKSIDADGLTVQTLSGEVSEITVDSGDDLIGTRDSFMVKTFLESVVYDVAALDGMNETGS